MPQLQPTRYKKPSLINSVSLTLLAGFAATIYVLWTLWPAFALASEVKNQMEGLLPTVYQANLRGEPYASQQMALIKKGLYETLVKTGVRDKALEIAIRRDKKKVSIDAHFSSTVVFQGLGKSYTFAQNPHVETSAARVDW